MGSDAVREIVIVDFTKQDTKKTGFEARKREYAVIPSTDGDGTDAYTYCIFHIPVAVSNIGI